MAGDILDLSGNIVFAEGFRTPDGDVSGGDGDAPEVDFATVSAIEGDWRGEGTETLLDALTALQALASGG